MRRRLPDVDRVDVSEMTDDELRETRRRWWAADLDAAKRGTDYHLAWRAANPCPGPSPYEHLRRPAGSGRGRPRDGFARPTPRDPSP